ncbi:MAG: hypothetical protein IJA33_05280 [Oscillospiraceae bacterium]|nr:hypothetical protein [Oscillospiraceae bacterium]
MKHRGYTGYHGRRSQQKRWLTLLLIVVLLLGGAFLLVQNYVVYDDSGKMHFDIPFFGRVDEDEPPALQDEDITIDIIAPEEGVLTLRPVKELHGRQLGSRVLIRDSEKAVEAVPEEDVVIEVKRVNGFVNYDSQVNIPPEVDVSRGETLANFKAVLAGEKYVVARMSTFCDSYFVRAYREAALSRENGSYWYDGDNRTWLDPTHPQTLAYITALCQELTELGVDELMLDHFAYPVTGNVTAIVGLDQTDRAEVLSDFAAALRANLPEETVLGIVLHNDLAAEDGINAELITSCFDRVYVAADVDTVALKETLGPGYGAERIVSLVTKAPESGGYVIG